MAVCSPLLTAPGRLEIFAFFMLTGIFSTLLIKETKLQSLEELSNEKQDGFIEGQSAFPPSLSGPRY